MRKLRFQGVKKTCKFTQLGSVGPGAGMISTQCPTRLTHQNQPFSCGPFLSFRLQLNHLLLKEASELQNLQCVSPHDIYTSGQYFFLS